MKNTYKTLAAFAAFAIAMAITIIGLTQEAEAVQLANPMKEVSADEMTETVGISLFAPENAEDIRYFTITAGDTLIGQLDFTLDGKAYTFRTTDVKIDAATLSGIYFAKASETPAKISYAEGKLLTEGNTSVLFWEDRVPGNFYALSCTDCEDPTVLPEMANDIFLPMSGDSDGLGYAELPTECPQLEGTWVDPNGCTVRLTASADDQYDAFVSIIRLTQFTGTGKLDVLSMQLTLEDPSGNELFAEFYPAEDGSCTLVISESIWSLLESGTEFTGFTRKGYVHDPRENPAAMEDIIENPDAVCGFSPNPESPRLGGLVDYDWTDPNAVEMARQDRIAYHESLGSVYAILDEMRDAGSSIEDAARAVCAELNRLCQERYHHDLDPDSLEAVKKSNLEAFGNEYSPTADYLFEAYGSWETVLQKALGTNAGMDACVGLYDDYYPLYAELGMIQE